MTGKTVAIGTHRKVVAASMRKLADKLQREHEGMMTHQHLRDAAAQMDRGNTEGVFRHLYAASGELQPQTLFRHGHLTDDVHAAAKQNMTLVHRAILRSRDIQDMESQNEAARAARIDQAAQNQASIDRMRAEKLSAGETPEAAPKPSPAMNAPNTIPVGKSDGAAAGPDSPQPAGSKQFSNDAVELVGPKGYIHGWIKVGSPQPADFAAGTKPGSFEHLAAIEDLGARAANGPPGDPAHQSDTMRTALHNVARSIAARDLRSARAHLESARTANRREAGGAWNRELAELSKQIDQVPKEATGFQNRRINPLSPAAQHPGRYVSGQAQPTADPTRGALAMAEIVERGRRHLEMSAETGALAVTPHPFGKPGGPGLWGVKNMQLPPYVQNIAHALLRTGRAKTLSQAIAMARGATKRWLHGKNTKPEVRAAAGASDAEWRAKQAEAHAHSVTPEEARQIYYLACRMTPAEVAIELAQLRP